MRIKNVQPDANWTVLIEAEDGRCGTFDVAPFLKDEAFQGLQKKGEFQKISNGGYFIEWDCGADLSADTIEAHWQTQDTKAIL